MAKLNRESKLRDKRAEKQARKAARKLSAGSEPAEDLSGLDELDASLELEADRSDAPDDGLEADAAARVTGGRA